MWLPRASAAYQVNEGMVVKGGYGVYYDSLNATAITPNQLGFSTVTTVPSSNDFGQTWVSGNPRAGISPLVDPFPVRADGTRFSTPVGSALGGDFVAGQSISYGNLDREHARLQRWRAGVQKELGRNMAIEVAYVGTYSDDVDLNIRQDILPAQYWNHTDTRNAALATENNRNITNPFFIGNLTALRASNPALYNQLAAQALFTSPTIQKNRLLRPYPHMSVGNNGLGAQALPLGKVRTHAVEVAFQRRFSQGLSLNAAYSGIRAEEWLNVINEYDAAPTQWVTSQNARPHRVTLNGVWELPFGRGRAFLNNGGFWSKILGGWQTGQTFEWQPGPLLQFGNMFFYGDVDDIALDDPTLERMVRYRCGLRAKRDPCAGRLPGAAVPAARRRASRRSDAAPEQQHLANVPVDGAVESPDSPGRRKHVEPAAVREPAARSDRDRFRPRDGEREHRAAVPDPDVEVDVLMCEGRCVQRADREERALRADGVRRGCFGARRQPDGGADGRRIVFGRVMREHGEGRSREMAREMSGREGRVAVGARLEDRFVLVGGDRQARAARP